MPTRRLKSLAHVLILALVFSVLTPSLTLAQSQSRSQTPSTRMRRPSATTAQDELDRINEARIREMQGEPPARETTARRATFTNDAKVLPANTLPEGTVIVTEMMTKLSSKTAQAGDRLRAKVITAVTDRNRNVLIPAGSTIEGQVQDVVRAKSRRRSGMIEISFDRLRIGKEVYPIEATLAPVSTGDRNRLDSDRRLTRSSGGVKRTAAFVGGGAGAGAAIGYVAGSALFGAGIGAGVGVAALLLTKGREAEVATGMQIGAELLAPISLNQATAANDADAQLDTYDNTPRPRETSKDFVYDRNEVKTRNTTGAAVPPVKASPRVPVVGTKPVPSATPGKARGTVPAGNSSSPNSSSPTNLADRQLVNVTNLLAERGSDDTVRVSITGQTPTAGWRLVPESTIENGVLTIKLYGAPPQSLAAQVISSATTVVRESDPNRAIQRVTVRGATNLRTTIPISRDTRNSGGNNSNAPSNSSGNSSGNSPASPSREELSAVGMRVADKSGVLLEDYARSLRAWKTNNKYSFETPRDEGTPEAQLLYAFDRLSEAAAVFRSPLNTEAKKRAVRDLVNSNAQVNRLWPLVKVSAEFKQRWQDIVNDSNQLAASVPGATAPRTINPNQPRPRG